MIASHEEFLLGREQFGMRFGVERMRRLLALLRNPQDSFPAVHVVGTNGKSTTTLMTAAALEAQDLRVGSFTSPHLQTFRERIRIDDAMIGAAKFDELAGRVVTAVRWLDANAWPDDHVTQFEAVTAIAMLAFAGLDVAVVEAGLGGRLDATNVLGDSRVQVLTNVERDHTQYLGERIGEIAAEKLAVVQDRAVLVHGQLNRRAKIVADRVADQHDAREIAACMDRRFRGLTGHFMRQNAGLALTAASQAHSRILPRAPFHRARAADAIIRLVESGGLRGRLFKAETNPTEIHDVAHNPHAATALVKALPEVIGERPVTLLVAMMSDKDIETTLSVLTGVLGDGATVICTESTNPRSVPAGTLADLVNRIDASLDAIAIEAPREAASRARAIAGPDGALLVTGSNYLIADLARDRSAIAGATL